MLFKEFAGIDAWPHLPRHDRHRRDHRDREGHRAGLRRHQPRGHRRAPLLRDRGPAAPRARHPGLPRRPARHRRRRAGRAPERGQAGAEAARRAERRPGRRRRRRRRRVEAPDGGRRPEHHRLRPRGRAVRRQEGADRDQEVVRQEHEPGRASTAPPTRRWRRRRLPRPVRAGRGVGRGDASAMAPDAIVFAMANPTPRCRRRSSWAIVRVDRHRPLRLPEPDQQRARASRGSSAARSTRRRRRSTSR